MYPKVFFENFWKGSQGNHLFVCMPFHDDFNEKFQLIDRVASGLQFDYAVRVKEDWIADDITSKILDGIANSKMLLFDLSDDPKSPCEYSRQPNGNVLYELGIAVAMREPEDILLIKEKSSSATPFDIKSLTINEYDGALNDRWLTEKLKYTLENQEWYKSRRVEAAAKSIDSFGLKLMLSVYANRPKDKDHFNDEQMRLQPEAKLAILRLLDLGILWFATDKGGTEYAYHWTPFGKEVMKSIGIKKRE